jgi:fumarylacetoacetate (FAA) hydrolase
MKLVSFTKNKRTYTGIVSGDQVYDIHLLNPGMPESMIELLSRWDENYPGLLQLSIEIDHSVKWKNQGIALQEVELIAPVPNPPSLRDGYAFRQHVETARRNRGLEMTPVFDAFPVFYFGNHHTVFGPGPVYCMPDHFKKLDFELEAAAVICKKGKNIPVEKADEYIAGLIILNDFSARTLQMEEMLLNLGPAKGKDFASTTGPWLATLGELTNKEVPCRKNHTGKSWNLKMIASVNGQPVSSGNLADMEWTFAELIARASYGAEIFPGDIIGSGTVGTGCFLELNGTGKLNNPEYAEQWLLPNDTIELQIECLGVLSNSLVKEQTEYSILQLKKA